MLISFWLCLFVIKLYSHNDLFTQFTFIFIVVFCKKKKKRDSWKSRRKTTEGHIRDSILVITEIKIANMIMTKINNEDECYTPLSPLLLGSDLCSLSSNLERFCLFPGLPLVSLVFFISLVSLVFLHCSISSHFISRTFVAFLVKKVILLEQEWATQI